MSRRPLFLLANDDGFRAQGLNSLRAALLPHADVVVCAPDNEQSASSHSLSLHRPLRLTNHGDGVFSIDGTPADCVAVGFSITNKADVVLSGVNLGYNLGNSMWHSGTLAGAKQAALMGSRGIALSAPSTTVDADFEPLKPYIAKTLRLLLPDAGLPLVNVNFPLAPRGALWTRQSVRHYDGQVVPVQDPMGRQLYWFTVVPIEETEEGTDRWAIERHLISMTPLRLDLTDGPALQRVQSTTPPRDAEPNVPKM